MLPASHRLDVRHSIRVNRSLTWRVVLPLAITVAVYRWLGLSAFLIAVLGFMLSGLFMPPPWHTKFPDQDGHAVDNELGIFGNAYREDAPDREPAPKVGRNDPCTCGSGAKYKRCCGRASV